MLLLLACAAPPPPPPPDACARMAVLAPGPRLAERQKHPADPLALATVYIAEARQTGDTGFYTLADDAITCALDRDPGNADATRLQAHVKLQFHQFKAVETLMEARLGDNPGWMDWALYGDALMEQGRLDDAGAAYQNAMNKRPNLEMYDRVAWLRWLWGDVDGALDLAKLAVTAGSPSDPEPFAWVLTRLGWLHALRNEPAPEIGQALRLVPGYPAAHFARGRILLAKGEDAKADLALVPESFEAKRALAEQDSSVDLAPLKRMDPRGWACWAADHGDPKAALVALDEELTQRQDAATHMAHAYAVMRTGGDGTAEANAALATGIVEPRVLWQGGLVLGDAALVARAMAMGPGLLPSERGIGVRP